MKSPLRRRWRTTTIYAAAAMVAGAVAVAAMPSGGDIKPVATAVPDVPQVPQIAEPGTQSAGVAFANSADGGRVCQDGARWLRLRFTDLTLRGNDSVTVSGAKSGSYTFTAQHWPGKAFHTKAFEGDCVRVTPSFADSGSRYVVDAYQFGTQALAAATATVAAVGDVCGSSCNQTAPVVKTMNPQALILAGDNAYNSGTLTEYRNNYDPHYGQFKSITYPTPGNHEYGTSGAQGYFDYFGARAGERGKGYYSFDVGDWHFVALNSNISRDASSAQVTWLKNDLAANTKPCTAAFFHHPRFNKGNHGDNSTITPFWNALYNAKADLIVAGHDHNYQRYALARSDGTRDPNGVRQVLIGTGGRGFYRFGSSTAGPVEAGNDNTFGVGKLTLTATGYRSDFVPVAGRDYTDTVSGGCHKAASSPSFSVAATPSSVSLPAGGSTTATVDVGATGGFTGSVALSVSGLPSGVTGSFSPAAVSAPGRSTLTLTASSSASGSATATITGTSGGATKTAQLSVTVGTTPAGFSDDFESGQGWVVNASGSDTATTGRWERGDPEETRESDGVKQLGTTTSGTNCLVTGRLTGASVGVHDVDGGLTSMTSPQIPVPSGGRLTFSYTFAHGDNSSTSDFLRVHVLDGTNKVKVFEKLGTSSTRVVGKWQSATVDLAQFGGRTVKLVVEAADASTASLWESAVDDVRVTG
ncbi:Calcineurin-like phosphoesterase [Lentzea albidocapillata subsp. violacea]|uniref:Calcineurin-like phosphoesterase n=1 Tax=Lentzea albidocapillata subsp. violacea TaxID=128104 RepID=A0A1G8TJ45_9PSEU|nr:metallophosphoesterase [Lentzea albidocapillata]SDJ41528.1 Calcineurin-like phosphoesterase [Lentzea albidocapillata subsp. violacea]